MTLAIIFLLTGINRIGGENMIFDCDTHMSPYRNHDRAIDAKGLNNLLETAGVDKALVWLMPQGVSDVSESNEYIYESAKIYPRFLPFGWANVMEGVDKAIDDVKRCIIDFGFKGVKLNGAQNEYKIDSPEAMKVCEAIAANKGIIAFHIGADSPDNTGAFRAANVAKAFPETTILMSHMGGAGEPDRAEEVIEHAKRCPNMMLIGSAINVSRVKLAILELGADRVMFGSDGPFRDVAGAIGGYLQTLSDIEQTEMDAVMYKNALRIFGL